MITWRGGTDPRTALVLWDALYIRPQVSNLCPLWSKFERPTWPVVIVVLDPLWLAVCLGVSVSCRRGHQLLGREKAGFSGPVHIRTTGITPSHEVGQVLIWHDWIIWWKPCCHLSNCVSIDSMAGRMEGCILNGFKLSHVIFFAFDNWLEICYPHTSNMNE
jgi:hypothetical protein